MPAKGIFWVGLTLLLGGGGLAACQVMLILALDFSAGANQSVLSITGPLSILGCFMAALALLGALLVAIWRPRARG